MDEPALILAGPIVRRVEPRSVSVWVAIKSPRTVRLSVWDGVINAGPGTGVFTGPTPLGTGAVRSLRIGEQLHFAVVTASPGAPLFPSRLYSYSLSFGDIAADGSAESFQPSEDLKSEGLLRNDPVKGKPHMALGYDPGALPSFVLPPPDLTDLRLVHGSCRLLDHASPDALAWVDDLIDAWRRDPKASPHQRPHQLFLTGDQIYADHVAASLLPLLNEAGRDLLGVKEVLPTRFPLKPTDPLAAELQDEAKAKERARKLNDPCAIHYSTLLRRAPRFTGAGEPVPGQPLLTSWPADLAHFPAGLRTTVLQCEARLTTTDPESHLMSLGEYCAMYLFAWSNAAWPTDGGVPVFKPLTELFKLPANPARIWELHTVALGAPDKLQKRLDDARPDEKDHTAQLDVLRELYRTLPKVRRALANIPTYMVFDDHDVTYDWNINRAWRDSVLAAPLGRAILRNAMVAYALFQGWGNDPARFPRFADEPKALADLLAEPERYLAAPEAANGVLLLAAQGLFPRGQTGPRPNAAGIVDTLLGFDAPERPPPTRWHWSVDGPRHRVLALDTRTRRTFRNGRYGPPGLIGPEALLEQIPPEPQEPLPAGLEALVVLSATSVLLPSLVTSLIIPLYPRITDLINRRATRHQEGLDPDVEIWPADPVAFEELLRRLAFYRRVVVLSGEIHHAYSAALSHWRRADEQRLFATAGGAEAELDRCAIPATLRTAFRTNGRPLSPDASAAPRPGHDEWVISDVEEEATYMVRREPGGRLGVFLLPAPARIAQFTSSGMKNTVELIAKIAPGWGFGLRLFQLTAGERLAWDRTAPRPLALPDDAALAPSVRDALIRSPVLMPTRGWPEGTRVERPPDTSWRFTVLRDERADGERPAATAPETLGGELDPDDMENGYRRVARRHAGLVADPLRHSRGLVYTVNLGVVRFERGPGTLTAIHELLSGTERPEPVAVHRAPLDVVGEPPPRLLHRPPREED